MKRLKRHISEPNDEFSDLERHLLTNDSEALGLDPAEPTYSPTMEVRALKPTEKSSAGAIYLNTRMSSYYGEGAAEAALIEDDASELVPN